MSTYHYFDHDVANDFATELAADSDEDKREAGAWLRTASEKIKELQNEVLCMMEDNQDQFCDLQAEIERMKPLFELAIAYVVGNREDDLEKVSIEDRVNLRYALHDAVDAELVRRGIDPGPRR